MRDETTDSAYVGRAQGGPLDGELVSSRFPKGFLVVDKPRQMAWIYDYNGAAFVCREPEGETLDNEKRLLAADGQEYDVRAYEVVTNEVVEGDKPETKVRGARKATKPKEEVTGE